MLKKERETIPKEVSELPPKKKKRSAKTSREKAAPAQKTQ